MFGVGTVPAFVDTNVNGALDPGEPGYRILTYQLVIGSGATPGSFVNTAVAKDFCADCLVGLGGTLRCGACNTEWMLDRLCGVPTTLLDYASVRARQFRVVVACGLDGAALPGRPAPDAMLAGLRAGLGPGLRPRAPGTSESRLRFVGAVGACTDRLVLVRRGVDDEGRELAPSPYWMEASRVLGRAPTELDRRMGGRGELLDDDDGPSLPM